MLCYLSVNCAYGFELFLFKKLYTLIKHSLKNKKKRKHYPLDRTPRKPHTSHTPYTHPHADKAPHTFSSPPPSLVSRKLNAASDACTHTRLARDIPRSLGRPVVNPPGAKRSFTIEATIARTWYVCIPMHLRPLYTTSVSLSRLRRWLYFGKF